MVKNILKKREIKYLFYLIFILVIINIFSSNNYIRIDLTKQKINTISDFSKNLIQNLDHNLYIRVYLEGNLTAKFRKLRNQISNMIDEFKVYNKKIMVVFINPHNLNQKQKINLLRKGIIPIKVKTTDEIKEIYPSIIISYKKKEIALNILETKIGKNATTQIENSIEGLEYKFINSIKILTLKDKKTIAFVVNDSIEANNINKFSLKKMLIKYYTLDHIYLKNLTQEKINYISEKILQYNCLIINTNKKFNEFQKYIFDQFIMKGGNIIWLLDKVKIDLERLKQNNNSFSYSIDLNLDDILFNYGVRINQNIIKDIVSAPIVVTRKKGSNYQTINWVYYPLVYSSPNNIITKNINPIKIEFASSIDTINNDISKTVLLKSSPYTKISPIPSKISIELMNKKKSQEFKDGEKIIAVLLEGKFNSFYKNLNKFKDKNFIPKSKNNKMIIISDSEIADNQTLKNKILPVGFDKFVNAQYGNKDFILNSINYLLDDNGIMALRNKNFKIIPLDKIKIKNERKFLRFINISIPIFLILLIKLFFLLKKYCYLK